MVEFAASRRLVLMEGSAYAHHPLLPALVDILASGAIGQVTKIHSQVRAAPSGKQRNSSSPV